MESYKVIALSTAHITRSDIELLESLANKNNPRIMSRPTGFFIKLCHIDSSLPTEPQIQAETDLLFNRDSSKALLDLIALAMKGKFGGLEIDEAVDIDYGIATYEQ
ncbi:hypothetical protein AB4254_10965 [Vibrio breoganii]